MKVQPDASPASAPASAPSSGPAKSFADTLLSCVRPGSPKPAAAIAGKTLATPAATSRAPRMPKPAGMQKPDAAAKTAAPPKQTTKPSPTPGAKPRAVPPEAAPAGPKVGAVITQMRMRAAAQVQRSVADSRTKSSRQFAASRALDQVHATAHAASAKASSTRQSERAEDQVRVGLFQAIERECTQSPHRGGEREADPARVAPSSQEASHRSQDTATAAAAQPSPPTSEATQRAEAVAALVGRIEAALKDGMPTLSLGLADRSGASSVEIARTGKGEVAVRIAARPGKKSDLEAAGEQIKTALAARGLRLKSLSVA